MKIFHFLSSYDIKMTIVTLCFQIKADVIKIL